MSGQSGTDWELQTLVEELRAGNEGARQRLMERSAQRFKALASRMLQHQDRLRRYLNSDDLAQESLLRLAKELSGDPPSSAAEFLARSSMAIRRTLTDLARKLYGPNGYGANHRTPLRRQGQTSWFEDKRASGEPSPGSMAAAGELWEKLYEQVEALPEEERQAFDLLFVQRMKQAEAAAVLGVTERTVRNRMTAVKLRLGRLLREMES